jgi:hypothetical protein
MAKLFLDLKKMSKVDEDGKSTTFQHVAGHQIKVAHHGLSPEVREQMKALPMFKGGNPKLQESKKSPPAGKLPGEAAQHSEKGAGGIHVLSDKKRMADGGKVTEEDNFQISKVPGVAALTDEGKMPQAGDAGYNSGEAKPDPLGNGVIDTVVTAGAAPLAGTMLKDAGAVAGNEIGAIGSDLSSPGLIQKAMVKHGLDENAPIGKLLEKMKPQTMDEVRLQMAARDKAEMLSNRGKPRRKMAAGGVAHYDEGTGDGGASLMDQEPQLQPTDINAVSAPAGLPQPPPATVADTLQSPQQDAPSDAQQAPPASPNDPYGVNATSQTFQAGLDETKKGITGQQYAEQKAAELQGAALNNAINQQHLQQLTYQNHFNDLDKERKDFQRDVDNQHIDPNHYMNSLGTGDRIRTALSLILGGIGSNGDPSKNPAISFLQNHIDRDIAAQKANLGKSENLLSANMHQFGNLRDATDMTRIMQTDILSNQLKKAAASATDLGARARALQAAGALDMNTAQLQGQMAMRKTILSGMQTGQIPPEQVIRAIVPDKEQEQARKELSQAQTAQNLRNDTLKAFDQVNQLHSGVGNALNPQSYKRADAVWGATMDKLTKDTSGRVTPETVALMSTLKPDRLDTDETRGVKRAKLNDILSQTMHYPTLDTYGIKLSNTPGGVPGGTQLRTKPR